MKKKHAMLFQPDFPEMLQSCELKKKRANSLSSVGKILKKYEKKYSKKTKESQLIHLHY